MSLSGSSIVGTALTCPCQAQAAKIAVAGQTYLVDFVGHLTVQVDPVELTQFLVGTIVNATTLVSLLIQDHVSTGVGAVIGTISVIKDPDRVPPLSTITAKIPGKPFPAIQEMNVNIHVTIPTLFPGRTLRNMLPTNPGVSSLINPNVTAFPPAGDVYNLNEPMDLEYVDNPGTSVATITYFPLTVG